MIYKLLLPIVLLVTLAACASERIIILRAETAGIWGALKGKAHTIDVAREGMADMDIQVTDAPEGTTILIQKEAKGVSDVIQ